MRIYVCTQEYISKMYFSEYDTPEGYERMWRVNSDGSIAEEYQTL